VLQGVVQDGNINSLENQRHEDEILDQVFHFRTPIGRLWNFMKQVVAVTLVALW
jgi:hypothetical protein